MRRTTDYRTGEFLIDTIGGLQQFPRDAGGIYLIEHEPTGECYIGATVNLRKRVTNHLKPTYHQATYNPWVARLAKRLMREELDLPCGRGRIDYSPEGLRTEDTQESFEWAIRRNCKARVLEVMPTAATGTQIKAAENRWCAELRPTLNENLKSNYPTLSPKVFVAANGGQV